jgi:hypothetical protein
VSLKFRIYDFENGDVIVITGYHVTNPSSDEIEDLEMNLTDIIKQLQQYRLEHEK